MTGTDIAFGFFICYSLIIIYSFILSYGVDPLTSPTDDTKLDENK